MSIANENVVVDFDRVIASLTARSLKGKKESTVHVGYSAPYAVYVHEDMEANHPNGGQAKYLSEPASSSAVQEAMRNKIREKLANKESLTDALIAGGNILLKASRPLVPVDMGLLRDSGFIEITESRTLVDLRTQDPSTQGEAQ